MICMEHSEWIKRLVIGIVICGMGIAFLLIMSVWNSIDIYKLKNQVNNLEVQTADLRLTIWGLGYSKYPPLGGPNPEYRLPTEIQ